MDLGATGISGSLSTPAWVSGRGAGGAGDAAGASQRREDFLTALGRRGGQTQAEPEARARAAAQDFVSIAFVQPILKELRESNKTPPPFGPGQAEKHLRGLLDSTMAQQVVRSARFGLVDRLARDLLTNTRAAAAGGGAGEEADAVGAARPGGAK